MLFYLIVYSLMTMGAFAVLVDLVAQAFDAYTRPASAAPERPAVAAAFRLFVPLTGDPAIRSGKTKVINYNSDTRDPVLPDVPTSKEMGYPYFKVKPPGVRPEYFVLAYLEPIEGNGVQVTWNAVVEMEGAPKPALVAEWIGRHYYP